MRLKSTFKPLISVLRTISASTLRCLTPLIVNGLNNGFWEFRKKGIGKRESALIIRISDYYQERFNCYIGRNTHFETEPVLPHGFAGIFISDNAKIGRNVVIFQQVTIGSNSLKGHPREGSPIIGDNVYIGAGAKIIGNVTIGDNCRIGANCVIVKDMPANTTAVLPSPRFITREASSNNEFVAVN